MIAAELKAQALAGGGNNEVVVEEVGKEPKAGFGIAKQFQKSVETAS